MAELYTSELKKRLIMFFDELIEQFPTRPKFLLVRIYIKDKSSPESLMGMYIRDVLPYKKLIEDRNEILFMEIDALYKACFGATSKKAVEELKNMWKKDFDDEDKQAIWDWFKLFNSLSSKYHKKFGCVPGYECDLENLQQEINARYY